MNCETARSDLVLYLHGELAFDEEEALEQHLESCPDCRAERETLERMFSALDQSEAEVPADLLSRCRRDLHAQLSESRKPRLSLGNLWRKWFVHPPAWAKPIGALAMLAVGFLGARLIPETSVLSRFTGAHGQAPVVRRVRFVNPDPGGAVRVRYDEVRQREMSGSLDDDRIRQLLLSAAADPADPGLRVESIDLLKRDPADQEVRRALLNALRTDTNSGVRLKALEGLKAFAQDPETRKAIAQVLLTDDNPGVRIQAIDLLVENKQPEIAGVLQELLRREENSYVRDRSLKALGEMKASQGTF
jgi:hypothetical protein